MKKVVVIGAGLAGTLVSNQLSRTCDVTLLEIGPENSYVTPGVRCLRKELAQVATYCRGGGGTTNLWHNGLIPIHEADVSSSEFKRVLAESRPYTDAAAESLYFDFDSFDREYRRVKRTMNDLVADIRGLEESVDCLIYPKKFAKVKPHRAVTVYYSVENLDFKVAEGQLSEISFVSGNRAEKIQADVCIVAAGAFGSPEIINKVAVAAGRQVPPAGVGFIDHPIGFVGKVKIKKELSHIFDKLSVYDQGRYISRSLIRVKSDCGRYTCGIFFRPAMSMSNRLDIYKFKSLLGASCGLERIRNLFSPKLFHPDILAEIVSHLFSVRIPGRIYNIFLVAEQRGGSNRVFHENGTVNVDWCISDGELDVYRQILEKLRTTLADISDRVNVKTDITEDWLWSGAHHSCTTLMGTDSRGLIDTDLKLNFCDNVYVCDGSVIQEHSYANTGLTIGQLAFRLAEKISNTTASTERLAPLS